MAININRNVSDPFYRYKMPKLMAKVEGKGNGIKTVIANMTEVAKALERPPMYPTKYFGCELGAQTNFDAKNERYIVNGAHDAAKLQDILDGFIKKFVLCPSCDNPETAIMVRRKVIHSKCKACGHAFIIDNKHKLATFIINNPPKIEGIVADAPGKENVNGSKENAEDDDAIAAPENPPDEADDDDDWAPAPPMESEKLAANIGKLVLDSDQEKSLEERLDMFERFVIDENEKGTLGDGKGVADEAERLDIKQKAPVVLVLVLLNENLLKDDQLKTFRRMFLRFTLNDKKAQRYLLGGIEKLIAAHENELLNYSAHIIKALYDTDVVEEEALLAWGEKPSSKFISKSTAKKIIQKAEKVLTWLKEAEEDSEEQSESDAEVEFDERHRPTGQYVEKAKEIAAKAAAAEEVKVQNDEGEEIDIDDI